MARSYVGEARRRGLGTRRERIGPVIRRLAEEHADAAIALRFRTDVELLVSVMLSAQTTDVNVNRVTERLFRKYRRPEDYLAVPVEELERDIYATGFYRQKAKAIQSSARDIVERFGGRVPGTMEDLLSLHGVARKTANVVLGNAFGVPGLTVDTHMKRVNGRLGLTRHEDPVKIERDLMELISQKDWTLYSHRVIHHGRVCCVALRPRCGECPLAVDCPWPRTRAGVRGIAPTRPRAAAR